jgi:hypothetical protein
VKPPKTFGLFWCFEPLSKQRKRTELFRNKPKLTKNPKFVEKYPNMLSFKLFGWVFCLFQFNRNIETLCFGIEAKQPKQTVSKQTEKTEKAGKNRKNPKFSEKIAKYAPYQTVSVCLLFLSVK